MSTVSNIRAPERLEPLPFTWEDAITVLDNETYLLRDLPLKDTLGRTAFTVSQTKLHPRMQTNGHVHEHETELYYFVSGNGLMGLDRKFLRVEPGHFIVVEPNVFHIVINLGNDDLVFNCTMQGIMKRGGKQPQPQKR